MNIDYIVQTLKANGLDYDRDFDHLIALGYDGNECQKLSGEIVEKLDEIVRAGVNRGFNRSMRDAVKDLTKLAVKLSKHGSEKNILKHRNNFSGIEAGLRLNDEGDRALSVKAFIYPAIDTSIRGARVLIDAHVSDTREHILEESIEKLQEIRSIIESALDDSSQTALDRAVDIQNDIVQWRTKTATNMHDERTLEFLDDAIGCAEAWRNLHATLRPKDRVTEEDLRQVRQDFNKDGIGRIAASSDVMRDISMFCENMGRYRASNDEYYNTDALEEQIGDANGKLTALKKEKETLTLQLANGTLDGASFVRQGKRIDARVGILSQTVEDLSREIQQREAGKLGYMKTLRILEVVNRTLKKYQSGLDLGMLSTIGATVNFTTLFSIMAGRGTINDVSEVFKVLRTGQAIDEQRAKLQRELDEGMRALDEEIDRSYEQLTGTTVSEAQKRREEEDKAYIEAALADLKRKADSEGEDPVDPVRVRLTDTDDDK